MKTWAYGLACAVAVGSASQFAAAASETVNLTPDGFRGLNTSKLIAHWDLPGTGGITQTSQIGAYLWKINSDSLDPNGTFSGLKAGAAPQLASYCIQAFQFFSGTTTFTVDPLVNSPTNGLDAGYIDALSALQLQSLIDAHWNEALGDVTGVKAAAFQLAVWEIEYDGGNHSPGTGENINGVNVLGTGIFTVIDTGTSGSTADMAFQDAKSWLSTLTVNLNEQITAIAIGDYHSNNVQDQITANPNPGSGVSPSVPLPAALPVGLSMMAGLTVVRKLRKKKA